VLILGVLVSLFLFYWMVVMATNATENIIKLPPALTPGGEPLVVLVDPDQEMRRSAPLHTRHGVPIVFLVGARNFGANPAKGAVRG
jgi:ABC-type glycerol-3-phosphate transport system permease component